MNKIKKHFEYTVHNILAHPLMELLHLFGFTKIGNALHDYTLPKTEQEEKTNDSNNIDSH